jgi:hypothetical protein
VVIDSSAILTFWLYLYSDLYGGIVITQGQEDHRCAEQKIAVLLDACSTAAKHYDDYYKGFVSLDGKAQGVATVSGLVLAAVAAFFKDGRLSAIAQTAWWWRVSILAIPLLALGAVIISLQGALVHEMVEPFDAPGSILDAEGLVELSRDQFHSDAVIAYYRSQLMRWRRCLDGTAENEGMRRSVAKKSNYVLLGQRLMMTALGLLTLVFGMSVLAAQTAVK